MKLSVDCGNFGSNEECASASDAMKKLGIIIDEDVAEIKVIKKAPDDGWLGQDGES